MRHLKYSIENACYNRELFLLTRTPRVSKEDDRDHDDSTWIMVMLTIGQDFPNAGPPIRTWYGQEGHWILYCPSLPR